MTIGVSRIFRSTDASAPQLTLTQGSLTTLLKAVLVDGYGSTAPLGFDQIFQATNKLVVRSKYGTRQFIRFYDESQLYTTLKAYDSMNTVDSGINVMPTETDMAYWHHRSNATAGNLPWIIIGDELGFWFIPRLCYLVSNALTNGMSNLFAAYYAGDYPVTDSKNKWNFCITATTNASVSNGLYLASGFLRRPYSGSLSVAYAKPLSLVGVGNNNVFGENFYVSTIPTSSYAIQNVYGNILHKKVHICQYESTYSIMLGTYPGLFEIYHKTSNATSYDGTNTPPYLEWTDQNGILNLLFSISMTGTALVPSTTNKIILKVGAGFRNV